MTKIRLTEAKLKGMIKEAVDAIIQQPDIEAQEATPISTYQKEIETKKSSLSDQLDDLGPIKQKAQKVVNDVNEMTQIVKQFYTLNQETDEYLKKLVNITQSLLPVLKQTGNRGAMQEIYTILNKYSGRNIAASRQEFMTKYQYKHNSFKNDFMDMWKSVTEKTTQEN